MTSPEKLTCQQAAALMSQAQDRALSPAEKLRLQAHLAICRMCSNFQQQMNFLRQAWRRHPRRDEEEDKDASQRGDS